MTRVLLRGIPLIILAASLSGCMSLAKRVQDNLANAEELSLRCEKLANVVPSDESKSFVELFESRLSKNCSSVDSSGSCLSVIDQIAELGKRLKEKKPDVDEKTKEKIELLKEKLTKLNEAVSILQAAIHANLKEGSKTFNDVNTKFTSVTVKCRGGTFSGCRQAQSELLKELNNNAVGDAKAKMKEFDKTLKDFNQKLTSLKGTNTVAQDREYLEIVELADQIAAALTAQRETFRVVTTDALDEFVTTFFQQPISLATAEKLLGFIERQLEPVDRLVDKVDDKSYVIASLATYLYEDDIQSTFNDFYVRHVRRAYLSPASAVGFARAACARLSQPSPAGKRVSLITPFIFKSMTLIDIAEKRVNRCIENKGLSQAKPCEMKEIEKIEQLSSELDMASSKKSNQKEEIAKSLNEEEEPQNTVSLSGSGNQQQEKQISQVATTLKNAEMAGLTPSFSKTQEICWGTEIRLRQALGKAGKTVSEPMLAEMTARACGEVILAVEQAQSFITSNKPEVPPAAWQSDAASYQALHFNQIFSSVTQQISQLNYIDNRGATYLRQDPVSRAHAINCPGFRSIHPGIACFEQEEKLRLMIGVPFQTGRWENDRLVPILRGIATELRFNPAYAPGRSKVTVVGGSSQKMARCAASEQASKLIGMFSSPEWQRGIACTDSGDANRFLALARAAWSGSHLKAGGVGDIEIRLDPRTPEKGDKPFDRQVAIEIQWR